MLYILALLIGVIAGLRAMTAPAAVAWGAWLGWLPVAGTWASFMSIGATGGATIGGLIAGAIGAVIGTLGGAEARGRLAAAFGKDPPAAFIEDAVAIIGGLLIVAAVA
ncbi:hypothetical protein NKJ90_22405 [Mesorhizobium sp. M0051]|uniref:hypothetical protein n=1 Tax=Mesorhizobium sp. M0051 TaxID=2956862 RepID=UPI00333C6148